MVEKSEAERLVQAIHDNLPAPVGDKRPVHTIGMGVKGVFVASEVARTYCIAEHFQGQPVPVSMRFSNGMGGLVEHDGWSDVRGMAVRFHLSDGLASDLIATTLGEFFVREMSRTFLNSPRSRSSSHIRRRHWLLKICRFPAAQGTSPQPVPERNPERRCGSTPTMPTGTGSPSWAYSRSALIGAPESYVRASYHAVHTFWVTGPDGARRPVRFSWQPVAGVRNIEATDVSRDKYLFKELEDRLKRWPARFMLMMTIGEEGDALDDCTKPWPGTRLRVAMGTLTLTEVSKDQEEDGERISFNPNRLAHGIDPSNDPILKARLEAYEFSRNKRGGCPFKWRQ